MYTLPLVIFSSCLGCRETELTEPKEAKSASGHWSIWFVQIGLLGLGAGVAGTQGKEWEGSQCWYRKHAPCPWQSVSSRKDDRSRPFLSSGRLIKQGIRVYRGKENIPVALLQGTKGRIFLLHEKPPWESLGLRTALTATPSAVRCECFLWLVTDSPQTRQLRTAEVCPSQLWGPDIHSPARLGSPRGSGSLSAEVPLAASEFLGLTLVSPLSHTRCCSLCVSPLCLSYKDTWHWTQSPLG